MDETCTAGKKYGKETVNSIGGRAEGEREGNVTRWLSSHMHATRLLGKKGDLLGLMEGVNY